MLAVANMPLFTAAVFNTGWNLGFTDILVTDRLVSEVEKLFYFGGSSISEEDL
jgi:hypothetical protein